MLFCVHSRLLPNAALSAPRRAAAAQDGHWPAWARGRGRLQSRQEMSTAISAGATSSRQRGHRMVAARGRAWLQLAQVCRMGRRDMALTPRDRKHGNRRDTAGRRQHPESIHPRAVSDPAGPLRPVIVAWNVVSHRCRHPVQPGSPSASVAGCRAYPNRRRRLRQGPEAPRQSVS